MGVQPRGRHRRSTPAAWPRAWLLSLAVLLVAGAFGVGALVSEVGDDPAVADSPAIIRPSADTPATEGTRRDRKDPGRHEGPRLERTPTAEPDVQSATPDVRALRTSRRDTRTASEEPSPTGPSPQPTPSASEDPTSEPTDGPTADPTDEPTEEPSDEPTSEEDDDDLLPFLPGNGSDQSREVRSPRSSKTD